jgi:hypothetical protein
MITMFKILNPQPSARVLGFLSALLVAVAAPSVQNTGSVEFRVVNRWGRMHNYKVAHFRLSHVSPNLAPDLAPSFRGLAARDIPYGVYDYELVPVPGDFSEEKLDGSLSVHRSQIHVTNVLQTPDSIGHFAQVPVTGTLEPRPKGREPVWIILQSVYGRLRDESTVNDAGGFRLNYVWGNNVIIVCAGSDVLLTASLNVKRDEAVNYLHVHLDTGKIDAEFRKF